MDRIQDSSTQVLVAQLNSLLTNLNIPIPLQSPTDLTPSLLLAILESLLSARLPLSPSLRQTLSPPSQHQSPNTANEARNNAKIQAMKVFLGVFENDLLQMDVGLSDVDPRRLARGEWDEVVFVGELLCWVANKVGLGVGETTQVRTSPVLDMNTDVGRHAENEDVGETRGDHTRSASPATTTTTHNSTNTDLSMHFSRREDSNTSIGTSHSYSYSHSDSFNHITSPYPSTSTPSQPPRPRCIHEIEEPSLILSPESDSTFHTHPSNPANESMYCTCPDPDPHRSPTAGDALQSRVRYTGYIQPVDEDWELASFEASRRHSVSTIGPSRIDRSDTRDAGRRTSNYNTSEVSQSLAKPRIRPNTQAVPPPLLTKKPTPPQPIRDDQPSRTQHTHTHAHTLALLTERARLLVEMATLKSWKHSDG